MGEGVEEGGVKEEEGAVVGRNDVEAKLAGQEEREKGKGKSRGFE